MRAVTVPDHGEASVLSVRTVDAPEPSAHQVSIDVRAAGINFADIEKRRGSYPNGPTPPYVPGLEVAGVVREAGEKTDFSPGDRVTALAASGGYAERAVAAGGATFDLPAELSFSEGAALPIQYVTAHNALFEWGSLSVDETVLVTAAAGGVGTAAVQLAAAKASVIGVASTTDKRELVANIGADEAIDYDGISETAPDLVLDGVGGPLFSDAVEALDPGGRVVSYGMASGSVPTVATPRLFFENKSVIGYHLEEALGREPGRVLSAMPRIIDQVESGSIAVLIDEMYPFEQATAAHERVENRESTGKVVLVP